MSSRFDYIKYDEHATIATSFFKSKFMELAELVEQHKPGRASALVLTKLEEAYMWVGKMIRDEQIARVGPQADVPERSNE